MIEMRVACLRDLLCRRGGTTPVAGRGRTWRGWEGLETGVVAEPSFWELGGVELVQMSAKK